MALGHTEEHGRLPVKDQLHRGGTLWPGFHLCPLKGMGMLGETSRSEIALIRDEEKWFQILPRSRWLENTCSGQAVLSRCR